MSVVFNRASYDSILNTLKQMSITTQQFPSQRSGFLFAALKNLCCFESIRAG